MTRRSEVERRCCLGDNDCEGALCEVRELACQNGRKGQRGEQLTISLQSNWGARWGIRGRDESTAQSGNGANGTFQ